MKIRFHDGNYETLVHMTDNDESDLKEIDAILIDEISMLDGALFTFLSNTFARIHKNNLIFGGIPTLVVGDLAQLPPINPHYVFRSLAWKKFFPLFLTIPQRQQGDLEFYHTIVNTRQAADTINQILCDRLPLDETCNDPIISIAKDTLDLEPCDDNHTIPQFKHQTNLPDPYVFKKEHE